MHERISARLISFVYLLGYGWGPRAMSHLRKWWVIARHPRATIIFEEPLYLGPRFSLHMPEGGTFIAKRFTDFRRDFRCEILGEGRVTIGEGCAFTNSVLIQCTTSIDIGDRCMFGQANLVVDGNHRYRDIDKPMLEQGYEFKSLTIEDDATVTTKCTIIANLGRRCFVGANSVVIHDVPAYSLAAGVPARLRDYYGPPGEEPPELANRDGRAVSGRR